MSEPIIHPVHFNLGVRQPMRNKDFKALTYLVDHNLSDTLTWLCHHQESFDAFNYDAITQQLTVHHANGSDIIRIGDYLNASYGILITAHNFADQS